MKTNTELQQIINDLINERQELQYKIDEQGEDIHALRQRVASLEALNDKQRQTLKGRSYKSHKCTCERIEVQPTIHTDKEKFKQVMNKNKHPEVFRMKYYKPKGK